MDNNSSRNGSSDRFIDFPSDAPRLNGESAKALLEAIRLIIRQKLERVRTSSSTSEEHRDIPGSKRALAVSKTEAAKILGVSRRTIDYSIALKEIGVFRVGRRVLIPVKSLEVAVRRGSLTYCWYEQVKNSQFSFKVSGIPDTAEKRGMRGLH
jgi:excisionase family DNA binding protein